MTETRKIALITGGTDGIGQQVALRLAQQDYKLVLVGRSDEKAQKTQQWITSSVAHADIDFLKYDLSLMKQVDSLAEALHANYAQLDCIVHCAGIMLRQLTLTEENIETVFAVQYLARYLLTHRLIPLCQNASNPQIINVSAGGNVNMALDFDNLNGEKSYDGVMALRQESVANDMLTIDLAEKYPEMRIYCYGPGYVKTALLRDMPSWFQTISKFAGLFIGYTAEQAADDVLLLINGDYPSGLYDRKGKQNHPKGFRIEEANRENLRKITDNLIQSALL